MDGWVDGWMGRKRSGGDDDDDDDDDGGGDDGGDDDDVREEEVWGSILFTYIHTYTHMTVETLTKCRNNNDKINNQNKWLVGR